MAAASKVSMLFAAFALSNDAHDPLRQGLPWRRPPYADVFHPGNQVCGCLEGHGHLYRPNPGSEARSVKGLKSDGGLARANAGGEKKV